MPRDTTWTPSTLKGPMYFDCDGLRYGNEAYWADFRANSRRPSFDEMGIETARLWARRSADSKLKVGACILSDVGHSVVSVGYNGRFPGSPSEARASEAQGASECLHAEQNAIVRARWEAGETHTLYVTHEPCHECALLILAARHIKRVVYDQPYAGDGVRRRGSEILEDAGVEVVQISQN